MAAGPLVAAALLWACMHGVGSGRSKSSVGTFPRATVFSKLAPNGAPGKIDSYGNTLSLLLLPPPQNAADASDSGNGTVLIAATRANVAGGSNYPVLRRSTDGGSTFSLAILPVGLAVPGVSWQQIQLAYDAGASQLVVMLGNGTKPSKITCQSGVLHQTVSTDRGLTFAPVEDISHTLSNPHDRSCISPPGGIGIQLRPGTTYAGRMLMAATHHAYQGDIILRHDKGQKSNVYNASDELHHPGLDEMQLIQLRNGSVMALARNCAQPTGTMKECMMVASAVGPGRLSSEGNLEEGADSGGEGGKRVMISISTSSGGEHWSKPRPHPDLVTPVCNFGVTYYRDAVLFSGPYSELSRTNLSVLANTDGNGARFDRSLVLIPGPAGYSNIQCGLSGTNDCAVLFSTQGTRTIDLVRFPSDALLGHSK